MNNENKEYLPITAYQLGMRAIILNPVHGNFFGMVRILEGGQTSDYNYIVLMDFMKQKTASTVYINKIRPVLKCVEDMTEQETLQYRETFCTDGIHSVRIPSWASYKWLKEKGFDADGWIKAGLAVDIKTLT